MVPQQSTIPTLHHLANSQSHRCLWALEEIALAYPSFKYHVINYPRVSDNAGLHKIHRLGKSPILTLETTDGSPPPTIQVEPGVLTESNLILDFINAEYGNRLWDAKSEEDQRRDRFYTQFGSATLTMKVNFALIFEMPGQMAPFPFNLPFKLLAFPMVARFKQDLQAIFQVLEDALSEEKAWFSGDQLGIADINMIFGMDMASQRGYFNANEFPKLGKWCEGIWKREAYQRALAKGGDVYDLKSFGMPGGWALVFGKGME